MKRFEIILVDSKYPMNIGSVARTMACMSYGRLNLVSPQCDHLVMDAVKFSLFGEDILRSATVFDDLSGLKNERSVLFGFSRRIGKHRRNPIALTELSGFINSLHSEKTLALVFGGESAGLSNEQLDLCDYVVTIDNDIVCNSLSVPQATALVMYELSRFPKILPTGVKEGRDAGTREQAAALSRNVRECLKSAGFIDNKDSKRVMVLIDRMLEKISLRDIRLLHAIIKRLSG
jgi:tRNA/rRNA methyltransferase